MSRGSWPSRCTFLTPLVSFSASDSESDSDPGIGRVLFAQLIVAGGKPALDGEEIGIFVGLVVDIFACVLDSVLDHRSIVVDELGVVLGQHALVATLEHAVVACAHLLIVLLILLLAVRIIITGHVCHSPGLVLALLCIVTLDEFDTRSSGETETMRKLLQGKFLDLESLLVLLYVD